MLDSLHDLVRHMGVVREGRTAVIAVTDGWLLYGPEPSLRDIRKDDYGHDVDPVPGTPTTPGVGPGGTLTKQVDRDLRTGITDRTECWKDQMELSMLDDHKYFQDIFGEANRANVSFYPIDPRGLTVFDTPIGPDPPLTPTADYARLKSRQETLYTLAVNTDGIALMDSNNLTMQMRRIADDLTSVLPARVLLDQQQAGRTVQDDQGAFEASRGRGARAPRLQRADSRGSRQGACRRGDRDPGGEGRRHPRGRDDREGRAGGRAQDDRAPGDPVVLHRGPSTGNQVQPADSRIFPRSERIRLEMEAAPGAPVWTGALLDRNGTKTAVPVVAGERTDAATGQRWLTADITLAPLGPGDYVVELTITSGSQQNKTLTAIRVTQ